MKPIPTSTDEVSQKTAAAIRQQIAALPDSPDAIGEFVDSVVPALVGLSAGQREGIFQGFAAKTNPEWASALREACKAKRPPKPKVQPSAELNGVVLPGIDVPITATAVELFKRLARDGKTFMRGGVVVTLVKKSDGYALEPITPPAARTFFESVTRLVAPRSDGRGGRTFHDSPMPTDIAHSILECRAARDLLPEITGLSACPIILPSGEIVTQGFHAPTGMFVTTVGDVPDVPRDKAVAALKGLLADYQFRGPGDRSRAIAALITPMLKLGGHLPHRVPADVAEADQSQAGKTLRQNIVAAIYNESPSIVTLRQRGVGSIDETFDAALISGRTFVQFDNFVGNFHSPHLEAFLTAGSEFHVRVAYVKNATVDPRRFIVQFTSNGVDTSRDFANRSCITRVVKRERGYKFRSYPEGDVLSHVRANWQFYIGCVFAVIRAWIAAGSPRTDETRHDFREWVQSLDWIVQNIFGEAPLMDGHQQLQDRVSHPGLAFLRNIALVIAARGQLGQSLGAKALYELAIDHGVALPQSVAKSPGDQAYRRLGGLLGSVFDDRDEVDAEGFRVVRSEVQIPRPDRGSFGMKQYTFARAGDQASDPQQSIPQVEEPF